MYKTFREMWECSTKNWFSGVNFSFPFAMLCVVSMYLVAVVPPLIALAALVAIASGTDLSALLVPATLSWLLQMLVMAIVIRRSEVSIAYALTVPLGLGLLYAMLFDSSVRITMGTGVTWKGRKIYERHGVRPPQLGTAAPQSSKD
jgi:hypothetical protein